MYYRTGVKVSHLPFLLNTSAASMLIDTDLSVASRLFLIFDVEATFLALHLRPFSSRSDNEWAKLVIIFG